VVLVSTLELVLLRDQMVDQHLDQGQRLQDSGIFEVVIARSVILRILGAPDVCRGDAGAGKRDMVGDLPAA
jgi:hypothetical protein